LTAYPSAKAAKLRTANGLIIPQEFFVGSLKDYVERPVKWDHLNFRTVRVVLRNRENLGKFDVALDDFVEEVFPKMDDESRSVFAMAILLAERARIDLASDKKTITRFKFAVNDALYLTGIDFVYVKESDVPDGVFQIELNLPAADDSAEALAKTWKDSRVSQ
jgi:hypothetical protein